jgi:hypothetical protein
LQAVKSQKVMKATIGISARMILILLILTNIVGCNGKSSDTGILTASSVNNSEASSYILVDTGQILCIEDSDGHVTCTCWEGETR